VTEPRAVLVVAATVRELAADLTAMTLCCGVGPVEAAARTAAAIAAQRPALLLHVGIAGARRARGLAAGTLVIGTSARYCDLGVPAALAPNELIAAPDLIEALASAFPDAIRCEIGTSARVGGTTDCAVEAMEGFAVLRAAALAGIPAIEVRAISNDIEEQDRARWSFGTAFEAITRATPRLVEVLARA
jgi:futalosine hydrolase